MNNFNINIYILYFYIIYYFNKLIVVCYIRIKKKIQNLKYQITSIFLYSTSLYNIL